VRPTLSSHTGPFSEKRNVGLYVRESLGQDGAVGTVEEGKWADLVLLDADPTVDLENLTRRVGVMVRGRWLSAEELAPGLERIRAKHAATRSGN